MVDLVNYKIDESSAAEEQEYRAKKLRMAVDAAESKLPHKFVIPSDVEKSIQEQDAWIEKYPPWSGRDSIPRTDLNYMPSPVPEPEISFLEGTAGLAWNTYKNFSVVGEILNTKERTDFLRSHNPTFDNPEQEVIPLNWKSTDNRSLFENTSERFWPKLIDANSPNEQHAISEYAKKQMRDEELYSKGNMFQKILGYGIGGATGLVIDFPTLVPFGISMKMQKLRALGEQITVGQAILANAPRNATIIGGISTATEVVKAGISDDFKVEDAGLEILYETMAGTFAMGLFDGLGAKFRGGLLRDVSKESFRNNGDGIAPELHIGEDGELVGVTAKNLGLHDSVGAMRINAADEFYKSEMAKTGLFAVPKITGVLGKIFPIIRGLSNPYKTIAHWTNSMTSNSIATVGGKRVIPDANPFQDKMFQLEGEASQIGLQLEGLRVKHNGIDFTVSEKEALTKLGSSFDKKNPDDPASFGYQVATTIITKKPHSSQAINDAAMLVTEHSEKIMKRYAKVNNLSDDFVNTWMNEGYFSRMYNRSALLQDRNGFVNWGVNQLKKQKEVVTDITKNVTRLQESVDSLKKEILDGNDIIRNREALAKAQEDLRAEKSIVNNRIRDDKDIRILLHDQRVLTEADSKGLKTLLKARDKLEKESVKISDELSDLKAEAKALEKKLTEKQPRLKGEPSEKLAGLRTERDALSLKIKELSDKFNEQSAKKLDVSKVTKSKADEAINLQQEKLRLETRPKMRPKVQARLEELKLKKKEVLAKIKKESDAHKAKVSSKLDPFKAKKKKLNESIKAEKEKEKTKVATPEETQKIFDKNKAEHDVALKKVEAAEAKKAEFENKLMDEEAQLRQKIQDGDIPSTWFTKSKDGVMTFNDPDAIPKFREFHETDEEMANLVGGEWESIMGLSDDQVTLLATNKLGSMVSGDPNPLEARSLMYSTNELLMGGWLATDLPKMVRNYVMSVGKAAESEASLSQFKSIAGTNTGMEGMYKLLADEHKANISKAEKLTGKKREKALKKESSQYLQEKKFIKEFNDAVMGVPKGTEGQRVMSRILKNFAVGTRLGSVPLAQISDTAAMSFKAGLFPFLRDGLAPTVFSMNGLIKSAAGINLRRTASTALLGLEDFNHSMSNKFYSGGYDDITPNGSVTKVFDTAGQKFAGFTTKFSGMQGFENINRFMAANVAQSKIMNLIHRAAKGKLSAKKRQDLDLLGIDADEWGARFIKEFKTHGEKGALGGYRSNFYLWGDDAAKVKMGSAIHAFVNDTIIKSQIGNQPFWTNGPWGSIVTQFMGWSFSAFMRYTAPLLQRGDANMIIGTALLGATATLEMCLRKWSRGEEVDLNNDELILHAFSGSAPFVNIYKTAMLANSFLDIEALNNLKNDKYRNLVTQGMLTGPIGSSLKDFSTALTMFGSQDWNQDGFKSAMNLLPGSNLWWTQLGFKKLRESATSDLPQTKREAEAYYGD